MNFKKYVLILSLICVLVLTLSMAVSCKDESETPAITTPPTGNPDAETDPIVTDCPHETTEWIIDVNATCSEAGLKHKECVSCKKSLETATIETTAHTEEIIPGKPATCSEKGVTDGKKCSVCEKILLEQQEIAIKNHTEEIVAGVSPTCTKTGLTEGKICSACKAVLVEQKEIPVTNHTEEIIDGKAATCTETGLTSGKKCSVCGTILVKQDEIPVKKHTEETVAGKKPSCTETGLTDGKKCSVCGTVLVKQEEIPVIKHTDETVAGKKPSCMETGLTDGKKCSVCGTVTLEQKELAALGHSESDWIIDKNAEIGVEGSKHTECTVCKEVIKTEKIPAMIDTHVHKGKEWTTVTPATCTQTGTKNLVCECGHVMETATIELAPHTEETVLGKDPTCTATGLSDGKKCSVCGITLVEQETLQMEAHTEEIVLGKTPTCTATGLTDGKKCSVCDATLVKQEELPMEDHTEETVLGRNPTCAVMGLTDGKKCSECGLVLEEQVTIPKTAHTPETILGTAATCVSTGLTDGVRCSVCGKILERQSIIAKTDHTEETIVGKDATCTESGLTDGARCSECWISLVSQIVIPPKGHDFSSGTCTGCGISEPYGVWIVDGQGNPMSDIIVKIMQNGEQIKMYPYKGEFLSMDIASGTYQIVLDISQLSETYSYDESLCVLTPESRTTTIRLFKSSSAETSIFVGYPISADYPAYYIEEGATTAILKPNDYTFFIFAPSTAAIYTITYECETTLDISYHGGTFFVQGTDLTDTSSDFSRYGNGIALTVYSSNVGGEYVIGVKSTSATEAVISIKNAGDPGTRLEDEPWTPYLEDSDVVADQLNIEVSGTYTTIDLTDLSVTAVFNEDDGYYHLGSANGPIIFIDLTSNSMFVSSIQTICGNQRMGTYIYDYNGNLAEKRSYNELFFQYGMPDNADTVVDPPIRVPLTEKLAEAIQTFGDKNGWWSDDADTNIFTNVLLGAAYNQEYAWLLFCGYYA